MLWSAEEMLDGKLNRVDIPAHARTAHKGLPQKETGWGSLFELPLMCIPPQWPCWSSDQTEQMTRMVSGKAVWKRGARQGGLTPRIPPYHEEDPGGDFHQTMVTFTTSSSDRCSWTKKSLCIAALPGSKGGDVSWFSPSNGPWRRLPRIFTKQWWKSEGVYAKVQQAIGSHEDLLTWCKLQWYRHVSPWSGLAQTILQGTVKGGRRQGRQRKRWEFNIREWTGLDFGKSQRAVENRKNEENWLQSHLWCPNDPRS